LLLPSPWIATYAPLPVVALLIGAPPRPTLLGEALSFLMALSFAVTLVITRHQRHVSMAPATCLSQLVILVAAAPFAHPSQIGGQDLALLAVPGFGQIGLGPISLSTGRPPDPAAAVRR